MNPVRHRARRIPEKMRHLGACQTLGDEHHPMEAVPIPGFLGSTDLILQPEDEVLRVSNNKRLHATRKTHGTHHAQFFMSLCLASYLTQQIICDELLVVCQFLKVGYKRFSLMRALAVVKRQSTLVAVVLR